MNGPTRNVPGSVVDDLQRSWADTVEALHRRILAQDDTIASLRKELAAKNDLYGLAREALASVAATVAELLVRIDAIADRALAEGDDHGDGVDGGHSEDPAGDPADGTPR